MKRKLSPLIAQMFLMLVVCAPGQAAIEPSWIVRYTTGLGHETNQVLAAALDSQGNLAVGGSSTGANGDFDYLVLKYAPSGGLLWSSRYASLSNGNDQLRGMALDTEDNIYLTGTSATVKVNTNGTIEWTAPFAGRGLAVAPTAGVYVTGFSEVDFSTAKLNSNGSNEWVRFKDIFGYDDRSERIAVDDSGNVYLAGVTVWGCAGRPPAVTCYSRFAVVKYDPEGNTIWTSPLPPLALPFLTAYGIAALIPLNGKVYLSGISQTSGFDLWRLDDQGTKDWRQAFEIGAEGASSIAVTAGNITYLTGSTITYPGVSCITFKVDAAGNEVWRRYYDNGDSAGYHRADAMVLDEAGNIYVTGESGSSKDTVDWATIKYTPDGQQQWVQRYDGPAHGADPARAIAVY